MKSFWAVACAAVSLLIEGGCVQYQGHVLQPPQIEARLRARSLDSAGLAEFVRVQTGKPDLPWPPAQLNPEVLTAIAWFFSPELEVARAKADTAAAGIITARQRINPSISGEGGRNKTPDSVATYAITPSFTIETAGKRGLRILEAEKLAEAARIAVYETAWSVRTRVRGALSAYAVAQRRLQAAQREDRLRTEAVSVFQKRLEVGETARPELNQALGEQSAAQTALKAAEGEAAKALAEVAAASGLPVAALEQHLPDVTAFASFPGPAADAVQRAGLQHRADIRKALIEYEEVDTRLRLAIANQYPNISLNPGYTYQEGFPSYTLGTLLESLPVFHKNRGPIAEQEAARKQAEAEFVALQARVLAEAEMAAVRYRAALSDWQSASETEERVTRQKTASVEAAMRRGEGNRLDVAVAQLELMSYRRTRDETFEKLQLALGTLEDAMQTPVWAVPAAIRELGAKSK